MRSIPLSVLGLVASVAMAGTPYSVARDGRGPEHHYFEDERGGNSAGHTQTQASNTQSGQDETQGSSRAGYFTLVSNWAGRDGLPDFSDGNRRGDDRFDGSSSNGASGSSGGSAGSGDPGRSGGSDDTQAWNSHFTSFDAPPVGSGGGGGFAFFQRTGQGSGSSSDGDGSGGQGGSQGGGGSGGDNNGNGGLSGPDGGAPQGVSKPALVVAPLSAVPEPSTWMMMAAGVGLLGGMLRRGRARATGVVSA